MTAETRESPLPPERLAEAGVWIARLHGGEHNEAAMAGVKRWLKANPLNARAFEACTDVWEESEGLRRILAFADVAPPSRHRRPWLPLAAAVVAIAGVILGVLLYRGGEVATGVGEQRLLTLKDGTRIFLNTATRVRVRYDDRERYVELKTGEAMFDVAKNPHWPFIVRAGDHQVKALGTSFVVREENERTIVTLVEGKVTVTTGKAASAASPSENAGPSNRAEEVYTLAPGQRLTFMPDRKAALDSTSLDKATAWRRGQVVLDDTPLLSAVAEMNRYSEIKLVVERPEAQNLPVSGLFQEGDSVSFARAVAQAYGLVVIERPSTIILSGTPDARHLGDAAHETRSN